MKYSFTSDMIYWAKGWYDATDSQENRLTPEESLDCVIQVHYQKSGIPEPKDQYILYYVSVVARLFDFNLYDIMLRDMDKIHSDGEMLDNNCFNTKSWRTHMAYMLKNKLSNLSNDDIKKFNVNFNECDRKNNTHLNPDIIEAVIKKQNVKLN